MKLRTIGLAVALSAGLIHSSDAVVAPKGAESGVVTPGNAPRAHRTISWSRASQLASVGLPGWTAMWDRDTNVPVRLWGSGVFAAGAMVNPAVAEQAARAFLTAHLELLAPGASVHDFVLVANQLGGSGDVRSVGFQQTVNGVRVLGGAVGFSFKNDRLIMVSSTALPNVNVTVPAQHLDPGRISAAAVGWLRADGHTVTVRSASADRVIVPLVRPRGAAGPNITYRVAEQVSVESTEPGIWDVWLDASDASPIARRSTIMFASGIVMYDVPDRAPTLDRHPQPAARANHQINGAPAVSLADGSVTWAGTAPASLAPGLDGALIKITNKAGAVVTDTLSLADAGTVTWSKASDEYADAQLSAFVHAGIAKEFARTRLNPALAYFDKQLSVNVNENQTCNAYSTGDDIHFYRKSATTNATGTSCENTGRMADVVYHEFGHSVHFNSVIPGVGQFDGSLSEGLADTLAASITNDHGMGRGFFFTNAPLRDLDPVGIEKKWPDNADGEVHDEGEIIGEALWDLRKALIAKLGETAGFNQFLKVYYGIMQRSSDIPTSFAEALVADDDDGNLANGTPNECELITAFAPHGLANPTVTLGLKAPTREGNTVTLAAAAPANPACQTATISSVVLDWKLRGGEGGSLPLIAGASGYSAAIPAQPNGSVVQYKVTVTLSDGSKTAFPDNPADPMYEFYSGEVTKLWCADFEAGAADWMHGATPANRDEWQAGAPMGLGGDPATAHGGTNVFGIDLTTDGQYKPRSMTFAESPEIDLAGNTNVRLQYYRWLGTEDGFYDSARIMANGTKVWNNFTSATDPMAAEVNHIDKEWRFQDVDLSAQAASGKLKLRFELDSDAGANFAGWNIDDVCIVIAKAGPVCGNGAVEAGETCDDANTTDGDGCSATCQTEGAAGQDAAGGCCSVGGGPEGALALSVLTLGVVLRRRKRA